MNSRTRTQGRHFETLERRNLLTTVALLGNDASAPYAYVDGWESNLVVNESDTYTNAGSEAVTLDLGEFRFAADRLGGPVTPLLLSVDGDNDFTVLTVGTSRTDYVVGANSYEFGGGAIVVQPGETIVAGFMDALADGSGGDAGAVVSFNVGAGADEIWLTGGVDGTDSASITGAAILEGTSTLNANRDYGFSVTLTAPDDNAIVFGDGGFESPDLGSADEAADAPAGWVVSGYGEAGVQRVGLTATEGDQFAYLHGDAVVTTGVGVASIEAGAYAVSVDVGNAQGSSGDEEPGTYLVRVGYGRDANDFHELSTEVLDGDLIEEGEWREITVLVNVSGTSEAIGQNLLVQVEHVSFDNPEQIRLRGWVDDVRVSHEETSAVLESPNWPTDEGEALLSDKYRVWVTVDGVRQELEVLMSESIDDQGGTQENTDDRTLSWASLSSNYSSELIIEVEKIYGEGAVEVEVVPSDYGIETEVSADGKTATFTLERSRYVTVNFLTDDNMRTENGMVENALMIFADDLETDAPDPNAAGTIVLGPGVTVAELAAASTIYIPAGFHRFQDLFGSPVLYLQRGQSVYTEPGAFVVGMIGSDDGEEDNMTVYGRGAFSGREEVWQVNPTELINLEGRNNRVEGIFAFDGNHHGVTPGYLATIQDVKMWGWHNNNDGFRPWGGTVHHSFLRPVDDAFYVGGRGLTVTDTVVWQGTNGGVVTYGWAGNYGQSGFLMKDSHVIYPEWRAIGNNGGLLMSQSDASAVQYDVRFENITIDGDLPAITNIKLGSNYTPYLDSALVGGLSDLVMRDITVNGQLVSQNVDRDSKSPSKSLLEGTILNDGADAFLVENVLFENLVIGGVYVTEANSAGVFDIDSATTSNIQFVTTAGPSVLPIGDFNLDGVVNSVDQILWRESLGVSDGADADNDGDVDEYDYALWAANYGATADPGALAAAATQEEAIAAATTAAAAAPGEEVAAEAADAGGPLVGPIARPVALVDSDNAAARWARQRVLLIRDASPQTESPPVNNDTDTEAAANDSASAVLPESLDAAFGELFGARREWLLRWRY